ncbi:MAG: hypothetical protein AAF490_09230 [Chloroflexota bacterium]
MIRVFHKPRFIVTNINEIENGRSGARNGRFQGREYWSELYVNNRKAIVLLE